MKSLLIGGWNRDRVCYSSLRHIFRLLLLHPTTRHRFYFHSLSPVTHSNMASLGASLSRSWRGSARSASATTRSLSSTATLLAKPKNPYTDTLLLPKTPFPLRANAVSREHLFKDRCTSELYEWQVSMFLTYMICITRFPDTIHLLATSSKTTQRSSLYYMMVHPTLMAMCIWVRQWRYRLWYCKT